MILDEIKSAIDAMAMEGRVPTEIVISDRFKGEVKRTTLFGIPVVWENLPNEVYFYIATEERR